MLRLAVAVAFAGAGFIAAGAWLVSPPAGLAAVGVSLLWTARAVVASEGDR